MKSLLCARAAEVCDIASDNNGGGFGLFVFFVAVAGVVMVLNPIQEDHLAALAGDLGVALETSAEAGEAEHLERLGEMVAYESYYLWSITTLTSDAAERLELEQELVMSVGAVGVVWSPVDLQTFGDRYDANMGVLQEGVAEALEAVNPQTIEQAEKIVGEKIDAAMEGAAEVVAGGAASAAALTDAANDVLKKRIEPEMKPAKSAEAQE